MAEIVYRWGTVVFAESAPVVKEVVEWLERPDERLRWDTLMDAQHYLGFKQFAGRGLRYIAEWDGEWLALLGWQTGTFRCRPHDKWLGWHPSVQFSRLHVECELGRYVKREPPGRANARNRPEGLMLAVVLPNELLQRWAIRRGQAFVAAG